MASSAPHELLTARALVPQDVIYRRFTSDIVILYSLNRTAGRMLEALEAAPTVGASVPALALEYEVEPAKLENDLAALCRGLIERELLEVVNADPA